MWLCEGRGRPCSDWKSLRRTTSSWVLQWDNQGIQREGEVIIELMKWNACVWGSESTGIYNKRWPDMQQARSPAQRECAAAIWCYHSLLPFPRLHDRSWGLWRISANAVCFWTHQHSTLAHVRWQSPPSQLGKKPLSPPKPNAAVWHQDLQGA